MLKKLAQHKIYAENVFRTGSWLKKKWIFTRNSSNLILRGALFLSFFTKCGFTPSVKIYSHIIVLLDKCFPKWYSTSLEHLCPHSRHKPGTCPYQRPGWDHRAPSLSIMKKQQITKGMQIVIQVCLFHEKLRNSKKSILPGYYPLVTHTLGYMLKI